MGSRANSTWAAVSGSVHCFCKGFWAPDAALNPRERSGSLDSKRL